MKLSLVITIAIFVVIFALEVNAPTHWSNIKTRGMVGRDKSNR